MIDTFKGLIKSKPVRLCSGFALVLLVVSLQYLSGAYEGILGQSNLKEKTSFEKKISHQNSVNRSISMVNGSFCDDVGLLRNGVLNRNARLCSKLLIKELVGWLNRKAPSKYYPNDFIKVGGKNYSRRHGFRRKLSIVKNEKKSSIYLSDALSVKICTTIKFLIKVGDSRFVDIDTRSKVSEYTNLLVGAFQYKSGPEKGGFKVSEAELKVTTFTTAHCGLAVLEAIEFLEGFNQATPQSWETSVLNSYRFLLKMQSPSKFGGKFTGFEFQNSRGEYVKNLGLWVDEYHPATDKIVSASSTWNAMAIAFMDKAYSFAYKRRKNLSPRTKQIRKQEKDFYIKGALRGFDYFAPKFRIKGNGSDVATHVSPNGYVAKSMISESSGTNMWYRGDLWGGIAVGSDKPEYVIVGLEEIKDFENAELIFNKYHQAKSIYSGGGLKKAFSKNEISNLGIDPALAWGGVFYIGSLDRNGVYQPTSIERDNSAPSSNQVTPFINHSYYDFDAITAETKSRVVPCEVQEAIVRLLKPQRLKDSDLEVSRLRDIGQSKWVYASLDLDLEPKKPSYAKLLSKEESKIYKIIQKASKGRWSESDRAYIYSQGSSTTVHNALLLLRALEFATYNYKNSNDVCN